MINCGGKNYCSMASSSISLSMACQAAHHSIKYNALFGISQCRQFYFREFNVIEICLCAVWNVKYGFSMRKNPFQLIVNKWQPFTLTKWKCSSVLRSILLISYAISRWINEMYCLWIMESNFRMANRAEPSINQIILDWGTGVDLSKSLFIQCGAHSYYKLNKNQCSIVWLPSVRFPIVMIIIFWMIIIIRSSPRTIFTF